MANFGTWFLHCIYGSIAYLLALIFVDWMRSGRAFVIQSLSRYALAFALSLVVSVVILILLVMIVVMVARP